MGKRVRFSTLLVIFVLALALVAVAPASAWPGGPKAIVVDPGHPLEVTGTIRTCALIIKGGGVVTAPAGYSVTLTVNGVETGQALVTTAGVDTAFVPGTYLGNVVLTAAQANPVAYAMAGGPPGSPPPDPIYFPFRQALYVDEDGVNDAKSVPSAIMPGKVGHHRHHSRACGHDNDKVTDHYARNIMIKSTGECFNGVVLDGWVDDSGVNDVAVDYRLDKPVIKLKGNGRSDFVGYGAAIVARGAKTTLVVDGAHIRNKGVVRTAVVADKGANVVVKNSRIHVSDGTLPGDYVPTIDTTQMREVPWMLSLSGNNRATNLLGTNTKASYINSYVGAEGWGVLSTDGCTTPQLTAINSRIAITGEDGYGSYGIGDATERFLGCTFNVATYATISRGSYLYYGDSTRSAVKALNDSIGMGLTKRELAGLPVKHTVVNSDRFGDHVARRRHARHQRWHAVQHRVSRRSSTRARPSPSRSTVPGVPSSIRATASSCRSWTTTIRVPCLPR